MVKARFWVALALVSGCGPASDDGAAVCDEDDVAPPPPTTITMGVRNDTDAAVFLPRDGCSDPIALRGPGGLGTPVVSFPDCEHPACTQLIDGDCSVSCAGGGGACQETMVRIDPGATHVREWNGAVWAETSLPAACVPDDCGTQCFVAQAAAAGTYTLQTRYGECPNADPAACECPNGEAICDVPVVGDAMPPTPAMVALEFAFPDEAMPTMVIQ